MTYRFKNETILIFLHLLGKYLLKEGGILFISCHGVHKSRYNVVTCKNVREKKKKGSNVGR